MKTFSEELQQSQKDWKIMNNPFSDDSLLTDKTLKELGFEELCGGSDNSHHILTTKCCALYSYPMLLDNENYVVQLEKYNEQQCPIWKTVGSVRMLIEALKGDE